jgi:DNA-binding CsgD family transcriptional regulator
MSLVNNDIQGFLSQIKANLSGKKTLRTKLNTLGAFPINSNQCLYVQNFQKSEMVFKMGHSQMFGYTDEEFDSYLIHTWFHPEDKDQVLRLTQAVIHFAIDHKVSSENSFVLTYRVRKQDGTYMHILRQSTVFETSQDGALISNLSLLIDISFIPMTNHVHWEFRSENFSHADFIHYLHKEYSKLFTKREIEILNLLESGKTSQEIAHSFHVSKHTIDTHRRNMLTKSNNRNTAELIRFAKTNGLIP